MPAAEPYGYGTTGATLVTRHMSLTLLPGHSHAQQLVAELGSTSMSSSTTVTLEVSEAEGHGWHILERHCVWLCLQQDGTNLYPLLLVRNSDTGDARADVPWSSRTMG